MMKMVMNLTSEAVLQEAAGRDVIHDPYRELLNADHDRETGLESERPVIELYDIPSWMAILLSLIYFAVSFCAVIGNWMVLWIVIRSKIMRNVTNLFIANLAVADIIIGAFAIPFQFQAALLQKWLLPYFMCSFCPTVQVVSLNVSIFTLVTLSIDRHRAVTQPLKPRISKSTGYLIISCIWIVSILAAVPTFLAFQISFRPDSSSDSAAYDYSMHSNNNNNSISLNDSLHHVRGREDAIIVPIGEGLEDQVIEPMCWPTGLHDEFWKMYNHVLVALQYMLPIIIISIAYIHMAIVLSTGPGIMNESRGESDRVNHSKRRVRFAGSNIVLPFCSLLPCFDPPQLFPFRYPRHLQMSRRKGKPQEHLCCSISQTLILTDSSVMREWHPRSRILPPAACHSLPSLLLCMQFCTVRDCLTGMQYISSLSLLTGVT